jgi:hypothetical protein
VATVEGQPITKDEFYKYLAMKPQVTVQTQNGAASARVSPSLGFQALTDLVRQRVLEQMARDEKVWPTDADVTKELEFQKKRNPDYIRQLNLAGFTLETIKRDAAITLAEQNLITKGITVTKEEVDAYIKENPKAFIEPARADLDFILAANADKAKVDTDLASGQMFSIVAQRYSRSPYLKQYGARFINRNDPNENRVDMLSDQLKGLVLKTPELKTTDWIVAGSGMSAKFYIKKKTPAKPIAIDDTMREMVRRALARERGSAANDLQKRIEDRIRDAKINIDVPEYREQWEKAIEQLKQSAMPGMGGAVPPPATESDITNASNAANAGG